MFDRRVGPEVTPMRTTLVGRRRGESIVLGAADFGLSEDELPRRVGSGCGLLGTVYNQTHPPALRIDALEARFTRIPRPGSGPAGSDFVLSCPFRPAPEPPSP
jgi:hypothetical protein